MSMHEGGITYGNYCTDFTDYAGMLAAPVRLQQIALAHETRSRLGMRLALQYTGVQLGFTSNR